NPLRAGSEGAQQIDPLCLELTHQHGKARDIAARAREARDQSGLHRVCDRSGDDRNLSVSVLGRQSRGRAAGYDQIDVAPGQFGSELRVAAIAALCRAILDEQVLALDITELPQALSKLVDVRRIGR